MLGQEQQFSLWQIASSGGLPQKLLNRFFYPTDWSPDSRFLVGLADRPHREIRILDLQTRTETTFLTDTERELYQAHLSNDGNWVTFNTVLGTHSQLYVAPFRKALVPQSEWIPITEGSGWDDKPHFSYGGNRLFLFRTGTATVASGHSPYSQICSHWASRFPFTTFTNLAGPLKTWA